MKPRDTLASKQLGGRLQILLRSAVAPLAVTPLLFGVSLAGWLGCSDGVEPNDLVASVTVAPASDTLISLSETRQLSATAQDTDGNEIEDKTFSWESSDNQIATVSPSGEVTAAGNGTATVTATTDGVSGNAQVTVAQKAATITVAPASVSLKRFGQALRLTATAHDSCSQGIDDKTFAWESSDELVATVSSAGLVAAVGDGTATVTASADGASGAVSVTVQLSPWVQVSPAGAAISGVGATQAFTARAWDADGNEMPAQSVTWSSLNPNIATINATTGEATAVASGQVTVAADVDGLIGYALLTVAVPGLPTVTSWTATDIDGVGFHNVWGVSPHDVFAVGGDVNGSAVIAHYDGIGWQTTILDPTAPTLWGVGGTSSSDVFAVGDGGVILHYDGATWNSMNSPTSAALTDVWVAAPNDVVAVGTDGAFHYDGSEWKAVEEVDGALWVVWGTASNDVHYKGPLGIRDIWGSSPADVFAVGTMGQILHYDGGDRWRPMSSRADQPLFGVWGTSPGDVYAVGGGGTILHYDGSAWSSVESGTTYELWKVWCMSSGDVFVVNRQGLVLRGTR